MELQRSFNKRRMRWRRRGGKGTERERESLVPFYLDALFTRERGGGVSVGVMIECLDYQLDFRGVYVDDVRSAVAAWNRRTKEEKIRLGVMKGPRGRGGERWRARYHRRRNWGAGRAIGGGEKRAEIFAATFRVDSRNSVKLETPLTGLDGRRAADS